MCGCWLLGMRLRGSCSDAVSSVFCHRRTISIGSLWRRDHASLRALGVSWA